MIDNHIAPVYNENDLYKKKAFTLEENDLSSKENIIIKENNFQQISLRSLFTLINVDNVNNDVIIETNQFQPQWRKMEMDNVDETIHGPIEKSTISLKEIVCMSKISRKALNFSCFDIRQYVQNNVEKSILEKIENSCLFGNGISEPNGIITLFNQQLSKRRTGNKKEQQEEINLYRSFNNKELIFKVINKDTILEDILVLESLLNYSYRNNAFWIISRDLFIRLQLKLISIANGSQVFSSFLTRDGVFYNLLGRHVIIVDDLDNIDINPNKVKILLTHPTAYTMIEDGNMNVIENTQDIDIKLFFVKYFGGGITNQQGIIIGIEE